MIVTNDQNEEHSMERAPDRSARKKAIKLFLCGDVMTGRGVDQILPHPSDPVIYEPYLRSAAGYVALAEAAHGPLPRGVDFTYMWGNALEELQTMAPDVNIINLETSITKSDDYWKEKGINYRMHPDNIACITVAGIDCCALANNHVLDWGYAGLLETLTTLEQADIGYTGAGRSRADAEAPCIIPVDGAGRVLVFGFGTESCGIPLSWAASAHQPGINLVRDYSDKTVRAIAERMSEHKQQGDIMVASIHWGGNWGYDVSMEERRFAHNLIDQAGVDVIHGHSSHHVKGIEVYRDRLILYGCGDFLNDYEGISGYEEFRSELGLMYFALLDRLSGCLLELTMTPTQIKHFKVNRAARPDARWVRDLLNREGKKFDTAAVMDDEDRLLLTWNARPSAPFEGCGYTIPQKKI